MLTLLLLLMQTPVEDVSTANDALGQPAEAVYYFPKPTTQNEEPRTKNQEPRTKNQEPSAYFLLITDY
jgi:hypothetical protein